MNILYQGKSTKMCNLESFMYGNKNNKHKTLNLGWRRGDVNGKFTQM